MITSSNRSLEKTSSALTVLSLVLLAAVLYWINANMDRYVVRVVNLVAVNAILALSLNLVYGFAGMFSLGHAGFMAIGAYVSAILIISPAQKAAMYILEPMMWPFNVMQAPFFVSVLAGGVIAALVSLVIALPVLRLGGDYLGIATLGFAEIIRVVLTNITPVTNGALGLKGIPAYADLFWNYVWMIITVYVIVKLLSSNFGNTIKAVRDDEVAARAMGINTFRVRVIAFAIGAFFAGVGGALQGSLITTIDPKMFNFQLTFNILMIVVAGGLGSITGSMVGAAIITVLLEWLRFVENPMTIGSLTIPGIPGMRMVIFSVVLLLIILYRRQGIMGNWEFSWEKLLRRGGGDR
ncbi:ABC-type branched-chain amino acid transport system, permease component [Jonquetella anthropi DSM 22815]|uniref:ABC-type branched-chain amino acid transport system, permease component n=1 Tax=Jonquetella anthropi DSM 22815 TaxID=885272 RepID=H0ULR3_9BACT|nr:branched-chain amino acid ABC transporter permease [Jonquetella anthropi]EHM13554.1 ABC-type branched-chain amino acid transport system, permease component [Jonquetella anthropi DSM 22815]